jgi:hypothetical protein
MLLYGLLFAAAVCAGVYTLGGLVVWAKSPNRRRIVKPLSRLLGIASIAWLTAFVTPFAAESLGGFSDTVIAAFWLSVLIVTTVIAARAVPGIWSPISGGSVLAGAVWASAVGIYTMYAIGWDGLKLDDLANNEMGAGAIWFGALFFAPGAFVLGFLTGLVSPRLNWRRRQSPA